MTFGRFTQLICAWLVLWQAVAFAEVADDNLGSEESSAVSQPVRRLPAIIIFSNTTQTYDGSAKQPVVTTEPAGLPVLLDFGDASTAPSAAGSYRVSATIIDPFYEGSASVSFTIGRATPVITWEDLAPITFGTPLSEAQLNASADVSGTMVFSPAAGARLNAGAHQLLSVVFTPTDTANFNTVSAVNILTVNKAPAVVMLAGLSQPYDGTPAEIAARTLPTNLKVAVDYGDTSAAPIFPGEHSISAVVDDPNYAGSVFDTMTITVTALVRHAPRIAGGIDGSLQVLAPESIVLRGGAWISGDLLVPGMPRLVLEGLPMIAGTYDASGVASPTNYSVALEGGSIIRYLVRRIDGTGLPMVSQPQQPNGSRAVIVDATNPDPGSFATIRDLTLSGGSGELVVPGGAYGALAAQGTGGFVFGHAGASEPEVYHVQQLLLSSGARLRIAGPTLLVLANGLTVSGVLGDTRHPEWLTLAVAAGSVTLQSEARLYGSVIAPAGEITLDRGAAIVGEVASDRLTVGPDAVIAEPRR